MSISHNSNISFLIPLIVYKLMIKKYCIGWPCTTCGGINLEKETLRQTKIYLKQQNKEENIINLKNIFIEAMCELNMDQMKNLNKLTDTSTVPFTGSYLPYWSVYLRNIAKNDITKKSDRLTFLFDYKEIYTYWIKKRLNEIDLVDFMIFYNEFVPENLKKKLFSAAQELEKNNHPSLSETLNYKRAYFED